jgi:hypothetical protein
MGKGYGWGKEGRGKGGEKREGLRVGERGKRGKGGEKREGIRVGKRGKG